MSYIAQTDIKIAFKSLRVTKWRSLLTMLGVIIGIMSVVTIVSIGEGIKHQITHQITQLGQDLIMVRPGTYKSQDLDNSIQALSLFSSQNTSGALNSKDLQLVSSSKDVELAVPLSIVPGPVTSSNITSSTPLVVGTSNSLPEILNQTLQYGAFYSNDASSETGNYPAVLGQAVANELFPGTVPLGHSFTFNNQTFVVVGELNNFDSPPLSLITNFNDAIFIQYQIAQQIQNNNAPIYEILAKPKSPNLTNLAANSINSNLLTYHNNVQDFTVLKQSQGLSVVSHILNLLTSLIAGIAGISLLVGGIGIMNVMLVAVTERKHEIGIRKAIGATESQILGQFMTEAILLSIVGGVIGIILSFVVNGLLRFFTTLQPVILWQVVLIATAVSLIIGIIFGVTPAVKAARKDPIDSLRDQ